MTKATFKTIQKQMFHMGLWMVLWFQRVIIHGNRQISMAGVVAEYQAECHGL